MRIITNALRVLHVTGKHSGGLAARDIPPCRAAALDLGKEDVLMTISILAQGRHGAALQKCLAKDSKIGPDPLLNCTNETPAAARTAKLPKLLNGVLQLLQPTFTAA